jgi:hypothetical protein
VDAVLIAFGGHLPPVSAWDGAPVLEAIHRAHLAGVPVVAGFAHGRDQPLTKLVAHNHAQASAAVAALVNHNHRLLGRLPTTLQAAVGQVDGAGVRVHDVATDALRRAGSTAGAVAASTTRTAVTEVRRVGAVAATLATRDPLPGRLATAVDALGDPGPLLAARLAERLEDTALVAGRLGRELAATHDAASRLPGLLRRGFAVVTDDAGEPVPAAGPAPGSHVQVTTATVTFGATVDDEEDLDARP